jgi:hypothetical protein
MAFPPLDHAGISAAFQYDPADFSEMLRHNAAQFYGTAGQPFVERLIKEMPNLDLHAELSEIVKTLNAKA